MGDKSAICGSAVNFVTSFLVISGFLTWNTNVIAYDNTITHKLLTEVSVESSVLSSDSGYLLKNLGKNFSHHLDTKVAGESILELFKNGADFEDELPKDSNPCRAANHFHNPIKGWQDGTILPWNQAQMTDGSASFIGDKVNDICEADGWKFSERKSSVI